MSLDVDNFVICWLNLNDDTMHRSSGKMQQHVEVKYTFNAAGKVTLYEQNIIWKE
jgi:hypothetical protein